MIVSIRHKGLKLLWEKNDTTKLAANQINKIRNILTILDAATKVDDMGYPGSGLHPLKGELAGYHAVSVTGSWRIIFQFKDGDAHLVDYLDYH